MKVKMIWLKLATFIFCVANAACNSAAPTAKGISENTEIIYLFPRSVNQIIQARVEAHPQISLCLSNDKEVYKIDVLENDSQDFYLMRTNRFAFINNRFYPLISIDDMRFGVPLNRNEIIRALNFTDPKPIPRRFSINEGFSIQFKKDGEILQSGFATAKPK